MTDKAPELTTRIVSAFLINHPTAANDLPALIQAVHRTLAEAQTGEASPVAEPAKPAISIARSVTPDYLVCLEDGKRFKSLKRHLRTMHDADPAAYRARWGLKRDYPMVAPSYSVTRSAMAKAIGLGARKPAPAATEPAPATQSKPVAATEPASTARRGPAKATPKQVRRPKTPTSTDTPV